MNDSDSVKAGNDASDDGLPVARSRVSLFRRMGAAISPFLNKGTLSNCATFSIMLLGMVLKAVAESAG